MPYFNNAVFGSSQQHQLESNPFNYGGAEGGAFPPPGTDFIITEDNIDIITEDGAFMITE